MKSFLKIVFLYVLAFSTDIIYAASLDAEKEQTKEFASTIGGIFSTEMGLKIVFAFITIVLTFIISKLIRNKLFNYLEKTKFGGDASESGGEEMIGVITRSVNITILMLGATVTLSVLGIDLGILLGGLGFGLGFTLKSFLSNFISGIMMVTQGYYHIGDMIEVDGKMGYIVKINSLFTELETFDGVIFYIPNITFMEQNVANYHTNDKRRIEVNVGVDYATDLVKAKSLLKQVVLSFPNVLQAPEPKIYVMEFNNSSIDLKVWFWISSKGGEYFDLKSNVTETINHVFKQAGITIPFPQITISNREDTISKK